MALMIAGKKCCDSCHQPFKNNWSYKVESTYKVFREIIKAEVCSPCKEVLVGTSNWVVKKENKSKITSECFVKRENKSNKFISVQTCTFVSISSLINLIKGKKSKHEFECELNNGQATFGSNDRSMVTISYILEIIDNARIEMGSLISNKDDSFTKLISELNYIKPDYVDLES